MKNPILSQIDIIYSTDIQLTQYSVHSNHIEIYSPLRKVKVYLENDKLIIFSKHKIENLESTVEINLNEDEWEWYVNMALKVNDCL